MRRLICKAISDRFFLSLSLSHLRLYKYQMLIRRGMAALAAVRVQKLSSDAGGTRWDTVRWPSCAAQGLADPCIAGPSRGFADVPAESLCKILAARNSHLFCSYLRPALEIWTGERRAMWRGIMPAGWCTSGNKVSGGARFWSRRVCLHYGCHPAICARCSCPLLRLHRGSHLWQWWGDHLSSLTPLAASPRTTR